MKTFTDTQGRKWEIEISVGSMRRVKNALGIDLLAPHEPASDTADERAKIEMRKIRAKLVTAINADPSLLFDVIVNMIAPQIEAKKITVDDFLESMGGDAAYLAHKAFQDEWSDFFQKFHRPDAAAMILKHVEMIEAESKKDAAMVEKVGQTVEAEMARHREAATAKLEAVGNGQMSMDSLDTSE